MLKENNNITDAIIQLIQSLPESQQRKIEKMISKKKRTRTKDKEAKAWRDASARNFLKGYGDNEPDYTRADIKEPNPEYKKWKKGK
jgi:hypothetical protein